MNTRSDDAELTDDTYDLSGLRIVNDQLRGFSFTEKRFSNCVFAGCDFTDADLAQAVFERCRFEDCNLSNPSIERAAFDSVVFDGCKLVGLQFRLVNQFAFAVAFRRSTLRACVTLGGSSGCANIRSRWCAPSAIIKLTESFRPAPTISLLMPAEPHWSRKPFE